MDFRSVMADNVKWAVALVCPGEEELALLAELTSRQDTRIVGLVDPDGQSLGAGLAEIMGLTVFPDLESLPQGQAQYLIHPTLSDQVVPFVDAAPDFGLQPFTARGFSGMMLKKVLAQQTAPRVERPRVNHDFLEMETTAIHRTLSRLEEALDRESLLRWLLGLATRATRASSGSIMLYDEPAGELYLAFAYGLSQTTMHRTRVRLGEGISGRVAASGQAEFITDPRHPGGRRDRSQVKAAICAPINWENKLLGVLNVSTAEGEDELAPNAMDIVESLTHRFGLILDRFLRMQSVHDGQQFRKMEEEFTRDTGRPENLASTLIYWAEDLANLAEADSVALSILTADGDLLVADSEDISYESPLDPVKEEVLSTGNPLVLHPDADGEPEERPGETVFILPVGKAPCKALISVSFYSASRAHHFHTLSSEVLYLVNRHLSNFLEKAASADQVDRLATLAAALSDLALGGSGDPALDRERVLSAACSLTGGGKAFVLTDENTAEGYNLGGQSEAILDEANRLLEQAMKRGWSSSILTVDGEAGNDAARRSMLVVPVQPGIPYPGLVVLDKKRLNPLDGASFTEFDALFAKRLAPLLGREITPEPEEQPDLDQLEFKVMEALEPVTPPHQPVDIPPLPANELEPYLRSEMDRCDRYHTRMGLVGFRVTPPTGPAPDLAKMVEFLARKLRTSDRAGALGDGTILIIVPEDIQSLPRLQKRVTNLLQEFTGQADLLVTTAARVYPGGGDRPDELIHSVINAMS
jgi:GAF domain-containing protein